MVRTLAQWYDRNRIEKYSFDVGGIFYETFCMLGRSRRYDI